MGVCFLSVQLTKAGIQHVGMYSPMHAVNKVSFGLLIFSCSVSCGWD